MSTAFKLFTYTLLMLCSPTNYAESNHQALGKAASHLSSQASWNLTIMPDGTNLPSGHGTTIQGAKIFAQKCASCHGPEGIGASAEPLMGEVGSLSSEYPEKTVNSYWPYATTLFDYIRRTMPIDEPFSLSADEVYALCAYIFNQDDILNLQELNEETLPLVIMPNRNGFNIIYPDTN